MLAAQMRDRSPSFFTGPDRVPARAGGSAQIHQMALDGAALSEVLLQSKKPNLEVMLVQHAA